MFHKIRPEWQDETALTSPANMYVSSSSASDTGDITVTCVDDTEAIATTTVTMTGQTAALVDNCYHINRAFNASGTPFVGDVYIAESDTVTAGVPQTASKIHAKIAIGDEQTQKVSVRVPANTRALLYSYSASILRASGNGEVTASPVVREGSGVFRKRARSIELDTAGTSTESRALEIPLSFPAGSVIKMIISTGDSNMVVSGDMEIVFVED